MLVNILKKILLSRQQHSSFVNAKTAQLSAGRIGYIIGDIHGRSDLLKAIIDEVVIEQSKETSDISLNDTINEQPNTEQPKPLLLLLGDYIDRGEDSYGVMQLVTELPDLLPDMEVIPLLGNHEIMLKQFIANPLENRGWLNFAEETCISYGMNNFSSFMSDGELSKFASNFSASIPDAHIAAINFMPIMHEDGDFLFSHAGINPRKSIDKQSTSDLLWIREPFLTWAKNLPKVVVHGHTVTSHPTAMNHRIGIDTGAWRSDVLTCLKIDGKEKKYIQTQKINNRISIKHSEF